MRNLSNVWLITMTLFVMLGWTTAALADAGIPTVWNPVTITTGDLMGAAVTVSGALDAGLDTTDLTGPEFSAAPIFTNTTVLTFETQSDLSVTFNPPVNNLLLYVIFWRGFFGGPSIVTYDFDQPFTVLSGLSVATVSNGNTRISVPD